MSLFLRLTLLALLSAAATALLLPPVCRLLRAAGLEGRNFAGEPVVAAAGLAPALAVAAVALGAPWLEALAIGSRLMPPPGARPLLPLGTAPALAGAVLAFAGLGLVDDLWGSRETGGLRGHLRVFLRERRVTTGLVKLAGGTSAALLVGAFLAASDPSTTAQFALRTTLNGALIALAANTLNLLDLRPLRAAKGAAALSFVVAALALGTPGRGTAAALLAIVAGAFLPYLPWEARRRVMLGDAGANALGAALAVIALVAIPSPWPLATLTLGLLLFHLWTEHYSLSTFLAARPWLARLDAWGWRSSSDGESL